MAARRSVVLGSYKMVFSIPKNPLSSQPQLLLCGDFNESFDIPVDGVVGDHLLKSYTVRHMRYMKPHDSPRPFETHTWLTVKLFWALRLAADRVPLGFVES